MLFMQAPRWYQLRVSRRLRVFTTERKTPRMTPAQLLFRAPFPALWSAAAQVRARVREYERDSGPFRGCQLVSNRADLMSLSPAIIGRTRRGVRRGSAVAAHWFLPV